MVKGDFEDVSFVNLKPFKELLYLPPEDHIICEVLPDPLVEVVPDVIAYYKDLQLQYQKLDIFPAMYDKFQRRREQ